jgi:hypothetical protein
MKQFRLIDLFWITGLAGCIIGAITTNTAEVVWIGVALLLLFFWNRPVLLRFWTIAVIGIGSGMVAGSFGGSHILAMSGSELMAWGIAMAIGGVVAFVLFAIIKPPER